MTPEIELITKLAGGGGGGALLIGAIWLYFNKKLASDRMAAEKAIAERISFGTRLDSIDKSVTLLTAKASAIDDRGNRIEVQVQRIVDHATWMVQTIKEITKMLDVKDPQTGEIIWYRDRMLAKLVGEMADSIKILTESMSLYIGKDIDKMNHLSKVVDDSYGLIRDIKNKG